MQWVSAASDEADFAIALAEVLSNAQSQLDGASPHLVLCFASAHHAEHWARLPGWLSESFPDAVVLGCSAGSVIGGERELEESAGLAVAAAHLPGVALHPFHLEAGELPDPQRDPDRFAERIGVQPDLHPDFILLADAFGSDPERLIDGLDRCFPESVKLGGISSGANEPGAGALFLGKRLHRSGTVGVALSGNVAIEAVVAQGCRPVGNPMFVTRCQDNVLYEADGEAPVEILQRLFDAAPERDKHLYRHSLFLGIEMRSDETEYHQGDFLVRNLIGGDDSTGALAVAAPLSEGQVVQFHLRDAATAHEDLRARLRRAEPYAQSACGALVFSCLGRGQHLFGEPNHESRVFRNQLGTIPLTGFFGNGEIGPVEGRTFLHGYTSAYGIFHPRRSH